MAKAGRRRKPGQRRAPSGEISRAAAVVAARSAESEADALSTVVEARVRLYGMTPEVAKSQEAGSLVGRLLLARELRADQAEAARRYYKANIRHQISIGATPDATEPAERSGGSDPDKAFEAFCATAKAEWSRIEAVKGRVMQEQRSLAPSAALDVIVVRGEHVESLVGPLRVMLNALGRLWGLDVVRGEARA
tara:strand:- start:104 stop:682 length:579 start_codon:yes stop_codon:yes gene_type:complete